MEIPVIWKDRVVEHPHTVILTPAKIDGKDCYVIEKYPGEVVEQGTPMNAKNLNDMDFKGIEGILIGLHNSDYIRKLQDKVNGLTGEQIQVTLTNTKNYPFNNSKKTVPLGYLRNTKDYSVIVEVLSKDGTGGVGDITVSDKQLNGFKIEYSGGASSVTVNCIVQGGV